MRDRTFVNSDDYEVRSVADMDLMPVGSQLSILVGPLRLRFQKIADDKWILRSRLPVEAGMIAEFPSSRVERQRRDGKPT